MWSFIDKKRYITQLNRYLIVSIDEKEQLILVWFNITSLSKYLLFWWKIRQVFSFSKFIFYFPYIFSIDKVTLY